MNFDEIKKILIRYDCSITVRNGKFIVIGNDANLRRSWDDVVGFLSNIEKSDDETTRIAEAYFARRPFKGFSKLPTWVTPVKQNGNVIAELFINDASDNTNGFLVYGRIPMGLEKTKIVVEFTVLEPFVKLLINKFPEDSDTHHFLFSGVNKKFFPCKCAGGGGYHGVTMSFDKSKNLTLSFSVTPALIGGDGSEKTFFDDIIL